MSDKKTELIGSQFKTIQTLKRRINALEKDRMFARSLLLPNMVSVYKAAMYFARFEEGGNCWPAITRLFRACRKARGKK